MRSAGHRSRPLFAAAIALAFAAEDVASAAPSDDAAASCLEHYTQAQVAREKRALSVARGHLFACANQACPSIMQKDCARWLDEIEVATPTVVLEVRGARPEDVAVVIDGARVEGAARGTSMRLDPGPHHFRFDAPGQERLEQDVIVYEGEKLRRLTFDLRRKAEEAPPQTKDTKEPSGRDVGAAFYVSGSVGAAALLTGLVLGVSAAVDRSSLEDACASAAGCSASDKDALGERLLVADVMIGAGVVALAAAAVLYFTAPRSLATKTSAALFRF